MASYTVAKLEPGNYKIEALEVEPPQPSTWIDMPVAVEIEVNAKQLYFVGYYTTSTT